MDSGGDDEQSFTLVQVEDLEQEVIRNQEEKQREKLTAAIQKKQAKVQLTSKAKDKKGVKSGVPIEPPASEVPMDAPIETKREKLIRIGKINYFDEENADLADFGEEGQGLELTHSDAEIDQEAYDDADLQMYLNRKTKWARKRFMRRKGDGIEPTEAELQSEEFARSDNDLSLFNDFKLPFDIRSSLFEYQKACVRWLWELFNQEVGGVLGDEMGLGKTVQIISFLAGLAFSKKLKGPILVVVPATYLTILKVRVLQQWVKEFHKWWPPMRYLLCSYA